MIDENQLLNYEDYNKFRKLVFDRAKTAVEKAFPVYNDRYILSLADVQYQGPERYTKKDFKNAVLQRKSLGRKLTGKWQLRDAVTNEVVKETRPKKLLDVPYYTDHGTFIKKGVEYTVAKQMRLVPTVYSYKTKDGKVASQFNVKPRTGRSFNIILDPSTSVFHIKQGTRTIPLYPVLNAMQVPDEQLKESWGADVFNVNKHSKVSPHAYNWIRQTAKEGEDKLTELPDKEAAEISSDPETLKMANGLRHYFYRMQLDPEATERTLGSPYANITPSAMLSASKKALNINQGTAEVDDRDSISFQTLHDFSDFLSEKIVNDQDRIVKNALWKMTGNPDRIDAVLSPGLLNKYNDYVFNNAGVSQVIEGISPMEMYNQQQRVIRLGEGALSLDAAPESARAVNPSQALMLDPVKSPESLKVGLDLYATPNMRKGPGNRMYTKINDVQSGKPAWVSAIDLSRAVTAFPGELKSGKEFVQAIIQGKDTGYVHRSEVNYEMPGGSDLLSMSLNAIPFVNNSKAMRNLMGCVSGDTEVVIYREDASIYKGFIEDYNWCKGDKICSINEDTFEAELSEIFGLKENYDQKPMLEITLQNDKTVKTTVNHKWVTKGSDGSLKEIRADELFIGCPIPMLTHPENSSVMWEKVKTIKSIQSLPITYDLDLGNKVFAVNGGVFIHNSKFANAALPLVNREAPLVRPMLSDGMDIYKHLGKFSGAVRADKPGTVIAADRDSIKIKYDDGEVSDISIYNNYFLPRKTAIHNTAKVKPGDRVDADQVLATSNFTDDEGNAAMGLNVRTAYMGIHGVGYDDAIVISESAAKKLATQRTYSTKVDKDKGTFFNKDKFTKLFPGKFKKEQLANIDEDGRVQPGTKVNYGDPLILSVRRSEPSMSSLGRSMNIDASEVWDHHYPGIVVATNENKDKHRVIVQAEVPVAVGDKLAANFGGKGVVASIFKDEDMVRDKDGNPIDLILSNLGVISRTNPNQLLYSQLAKVARKRGKPYYLNSFDHPDAVEFVQKEMDKYGVKDTEELFDPISGKKIPDVFVGETYQYNQVQTADYKGKSRSTGFYSFDEEPGRGGAEGSKHLGCFPAQQKVLTLHGERTIGSIVEKKQSEHVWSYNNDKKEWGYYPITNWFTYRSKIEDILCIELEGAACLYPTKNHQVYNGDFEKVRADSLSVGDTMWTWGPIPTEHQMESKKFLKKRVAELQENMSLANINNICKIGLVPAVIRDIRPYTHPKPGVEEINVYDFTVDETHCYTAGNVLVSNSMEYAALHGHGAEQVIKDMKQIKGQKNTEFWRQLKLGKTPTMPGTPLVYEKFKALLKGGGVNIIETPESDSIFGMTDNDAKTLTGNRKLTNSNTFGAKSSKALPGGLFGEATGFGQPTEHWSYIELPVPMPNPVMKDSLRSLLGLTQKSYNAVLEGKEDLGGLTGPKAINEALKRINLTETINHTKKAIEDAPKSKKDALVKQLRYAVSMQKQGVHPVDFMMSRIPVIPPKYRPIIDAPSSRIVSDMNYLYKNIIESVNDYKDSEGLPDEIRREALNDVYSKYNELIGLTDPDDKKLEEKNIGGIFKQLFGKGQVKKSLVQRRVIGSNIDMSGLAVVVPNPELKLNEVGLPINKAWELYKPFIIRSMVQKGVPATSAVTSVENHSKQALAVLQDIIKDRPVIVNRAPTLHKYSMMAFWPKLVKGDTLQVSPSIVAPLGMDFDGDSVLASTKIRINIEILKNALDFSENDRIMIIEGDDIILKNRKGEVIMRVAKDTQFITKEATVSIEDIPVLPFTDVVKSDTVTEWEVFPGVEIYALDRETGKHGYYPITHFSEHKECDMFDVQIGKWYSHVVTVSADHSLVCYNKGELQLTKPEEASLKMCPVVKDMCPDVSQVQRQCRIGSYVGQNKTWKDVNINLSFETGVVFGAIIGDGWVDTCGRTYIASVYPEFQEKLMENITKHFPCNSEPCVNSYCRTNIDGKDTMSDKIYAHIPKYFGMGLRDMIGKGALNKKIPWQFLQGSEAFLRGVLLGLMETDGTVNVNTKSKKTNVGYDTISPYLRDTFKQLCLRLGIRTSVTVYKGKHSTTPCYRISLCKIDFVKFVKANPDFKFMIPHKQEAVEFMVENVSLTSGTALAVDLVPYPLHLSDILASLNGRTKGLICDASTLYTSKKNGYIVRATALKFVEARINIDESTLTEEEITAFADWAQLVNDENITWQQVVKVTSAGNQTCYDITVPGPFTFATSDGVIVQDTASYMVPVSKKAVDEAKNKMMPDQNLKSLRDYKPQYMPRQEYAMGLYLATKDPRPGKVHHFNTKAEAVRAYNKGEINIDDPIMVTES